jgi:hypothetical protein
MASTRSDEVETADARWGLPSSHEYPSSWAKPETYAYFYLKFEKMNPLLREEVGIDGA